MAGDGVLPSPPGGSGDRLGVWLTTVDSAVLYDGEEAERALSFLQQNGFTRASVPLYTAGTVTWTPAPAHDRFGVPLDPRIGRRDGTSALLRNLGRAGLRRVGWFEFGLMAPVSAPWLQGRERLLLQDRQGSTRWAESPDLQRVWLNPLLPEVQQFLVDLVVDACRSLPLEMIQFDDHLGFPVRFGYDPETLSRWRATEAGRQDPLPDEREARWIAWRSAQVTALLERVRATMRATCPQVGLSVAPNPQAFSYASYLADWGDWVRRGLVDEVVVQIYRHDLKALAGELADPSLGLAGTRVPVRIGLLAGLRSEPKSRAQLQRELELVRGQGFESVDLFFYESARRHFPMPAPGEPGVGGG